MKLAGVPAILAIFLTAWSPAHASPALVDFASLKPRIDCADLAAVNLSQAVGAAVSDLSASEVTGTIAASVKFEVRLPTWTWTQRFLQTGCGGLCGSLNIRAEKAQGCVPVTNGQIVLASTDMGHQGFDMTWGANSKRLK